MAVQLLEHLLPHVCGQILESHQVHWPNEAFSSPILADTFCIDSLEVLGTSSELLATAHPEEVRILGVSIEAEVLHLAPLLLVLNGEESVVLQLSLACGNRKLCLQDLAVVQPPPVSILTEQVVDLVMIHRGSLVEVVQQPFFCLRLVALQQFGDASFCCFSDLPHRFEHQHVRMQPVHLTMHELLTLPCMQSPATEEDILELERGLVDFVSCAVPAQ